MKKKYILFWLLVCGLFYYPTVFAEGNDPVEIGSSQVSLTVIKPEDEVKSSDSHYSEIKIQSLNHSENQNNYLPKTNEANYQSVTMSILDIYIIIGSLVILIINKKERRKKNDQKKNGSNSNNWRTNVGFTSSFRNRIS